MLVLGGDADRLGSAIFHPESSRVARLASGGRFGLAQSIFQLGGNFGSGGGAAAGGLHRRAVRPDQRRPGSPLGSLVGIIVLWQVGGWYAAHLRDRNGARPAPLFPALPRAEGAGRRSSCWRCSPSRRTSTWRPVELLHLLRHREVRRLGAGLAAHAVSFLGASAAGLVLGGTFGDRFGPKTVIWFSILGVLPFTLALPYANLFWINVLTIVIGLILSSAFSAIVVFAQELVPGRVGMIAGIFFGLAFGLGGSARPCSACWPTTGASTTSSGYARSCRCSACSRSSCRT